MNKENIDLFEGKLFKKRNLNEVQKSFLHLETNFDNSKDKINFLNMLKDRSIYDFNITLNENSKIITLSTCQSDTTRLVLHAVLI